MATEPNDSQDAKQAQVEGPQKPQGQNLAGQSDEALRASVGQTFADNPNYVFNRNEIARIGRAGGLSDERINKILGEFDIVLKDIIKKFIVNFFNRNFFFLFLYIFSDLFK